MLLRVVAGFVGLATAHLTGVRISELIGLRIGDVDLGAEAHVKVFRAKGDKHREVPIGRRLIGILGPYLAEVRHQINGAPESEVLLVDHQALGRRGGFPDDAMRAVQKWFWAEWSKGTDYEGVRWHPHIARHSYATGLLEQGVALGVVQHLLGHAHAETTAVYTTPPNS